MVVQLVREGLLFGADRNITTTSVRLGTGPQGTVIVASGQAPRPKVLKWPNRPVVVGYVGLGKVAGKYTDEWLYDFIGRNLDTELSLKQLADNLKRDVESDLSGQIGSTPSRDDVLILHLGGFVEEDAGQWKPQVWYIRNARAMDAFGYTDIAAEFRDPSDEIPPYFQGMTGNQIRADVHQRDKNWQPFWFHQGVDLATFNALDQVLRAGMRAIVENHPNRPHQFPDSLREWSKHLKMAILTYGAYYGAFHEPFRQLVGGGADVVWAAWP
jgi:hypothetical protein